MGLQAYIRRMTITRELHIHDYISHDEFVLEVSYNMANVNIVIRFLYRVLLAIPAVLLLRGFPRLLPLANRIARYVWIDRAIRKQEQQVERGARLAEADSRWRKSHSILIPIDEYIKNQITNNLIKGKN